MRVLVTGSNGFIGSHVCAWLRAQGCYVIGLGRRPEAKTPCDEYVCCDLVTPQVSHIFESLNESTVDAVVHLAADMRHEPYAVQVVSSNCVGTQRLLELCEEKKIPVFVQLSSLPVIGSPVQHPITEAHPLKPPTVYHVTKHTQEMLAEYASYTFGLRTVSFRICSPVGEGVNPKTIFPTFVRNAVNDTDLRLYGKGTRKQTYIHVLDIAQAILKAICSQAQGVYNLASYNLISNYDLAQKCIRETGSSSRIVFTGNEDPMDDLVWDVSIEKAKRDMGYEPSISVEYAIRELAEVFRKEKDERGQETL